MHSAVPLFLPPPLRDTAPHACQYRPRNNARHSSTLTRVVFQQEAPRGYSPPRLTASHQTAALFGGQQTGTCPFPRRIFTLPGYHTTFSPFVNRFMRKNQRIRRFLPHRPPIDTCKAAPCSRQCTGETAPGPGIPAALLLVPGERTRFAGPCPPTNGTPPLLRPL